MFGPAISDHGSLLFEGGIVVLSEGDDYIPTAIRNALRLLHKEAPLDQTKGVLTQSDVGKRPDLDALKARITSALLKVSFIESITSISLERGADRVLSVSISFTHEDGVLFNIDERFLV